MTTCLCISRNHFMVKEKTIWEEKNIYLPLQKWPIINFNLIYNISNV